MKKESTFLEALTALALEVCDRGDRAVSFSEEFAKLIEAWQKKDALSIAPLLRKNVDYRERYHVTREALKEIERRIKTLREFGDHKAWCQSRRATTSGGCNCGFVAAIEALDKARPWTR